MTQIAITVLSIAAVWCSQTEEYRRYACLFGLVAQPFWFYMAVYTGQWSIACLCFVYGYCWFIGLKEHWINYHVGQRA